MTLLDVAGYIYGAMATSNRIKNADSSLLQRVGDLPLRVGIAVNDTVKSFSDFFGADNPVSHILRDNSDWYARLLSAQAVENDKEVARILGEAKDKGTVESLLAGLKAFTVAPADFLASGAGSLLPFLAGGAIAKAGGLGYFGVGVTQASLSSAIQVGAVKGGIYEEIKSELISRGTSEEVAKSEALKAQQYGGANTDQLIVGGALGILGGRVGAQRAITRGLFKGGFGASREKVSLVAKEGLWEAGTEGAQGGQERLATNVSLHRQGSEVGTFSGVGSTAALEGAVGLFVGGGTSSMTSGSSTPAKSERGDARQVEYGEGRVYPSDSTVTGEKGSPARSEVEPDRGAEELDVSQMDQRERVADMFPQDGKVSEDKEISPKDGRKFSVPKVSPNKQKALGIQDNPIGIFLVARHPHLFQGAGTPIQYQTKLGAALDTLEKEIDQGKYLNEAYDADSYERIHKVRLSREEEALKLREHRRNQEVLQQGWKNYLSEGGYSPEQRLLVLSTVVKEVARSGRDGFRVHQLGGKSNILPCEPSPETAAIFFEKFKGDQRPSVVLSQADAEAARRRSDQLKSFVKTEHATEWGGTITWTKFLRAGAEPEGAAERVKNLAAVSRTVDQFGMAHWCCSGEAIAKGFIDKGDFWVGVDELGRARVSLRMDGEKQLKEISGVLPGQAIEPKFATVVTRLIEEQGFRDGEVWVRDAVLKGRVAEMKDPGSWEEFKNVIGQPSDEQAVKFFRDYRGPKGTDDFLVGSDNAELNKTIWEKTKDDGGPTPMDHAAIRGQFSQGMSWIDHSMLDHVPRGGFEEDSPSITHGHRLLLSTSGVRGADVFRAFQQSGYLTPERQRMIGPKGLPMIAGATLDGGKLKLLSEFDGLAGEALRVPDSDGNTGFMLIAGGPAEIAEEALSTLSRRGILTKSDQRAENYAGENLFFPAGRVVRNSNAEGVYGSSLSLMIGKSWVDHDAMFSPRKTDGNTAVMALRTKNNGDGEALAWLRGNGFLTPERQRRTNNNRENMLHLYSEGYGFRDFLDWGGLDDSAMKAINNRGETPAIIYLGDGSGGGIDRVKKYLDAGTILPEGSLEDGAMVENSKVRDGKSEPLVFAVARAGGLFFLLEEGVVSASQISATRERFSGKEQTPWHHVKFAETSEEVERFARLVDNGTVTPQILMERDGDGTMVATSWMRTGNHRALFHSPALTREVRMQRDPDGRTFGHHVARRGALVDYLKSPACGREEIEVISQDSNTLLHDFEGGTDPYSSDWAEISDKLKKEDFSRLNSMGENPASRFVLHEQWVKMLVSRNFLDEKALTQRSLKTGKRPLDLIPRQQLGETLTTLGENGLVSRGTLVDSSSGPNLIKRFVEAEDPTARSLADGLVFLKKHCGLEAGYLGPHEIHTVMHRTKPWHLSTSEIRSIAEAGLVHPDVLYEHDGHNPPVIFGAVEMSDRELSPDTEAFRAFLDNGLVPPARMRERRGEGEINLAGKLLQQASRHDEWRGVVESLMETQQFDREAVFASYKSEKIGSEGETMVADILLASGNEALLQKSIEAGILTREDFSEGGELAGRAIKNGEESLLILARTGLLRSGDLGRIEVDTWRGKIKGGQYLLEEKPELFSSLCESGAIAFEDVCSGRGGQEEAVEHAAGRHKLGLLGRVSGIDKLLLSSQTLNRVWYASGLSRDTGGLVDFLRNTGMDDSSIRKSLVEIDDEGHNTLGGLAQMGGDRIFPLAMEGIIGRKQLLGQSNPNLKGGDRDALNAVLSGCPENWTKLMDCGLLERGDLYRNQSSYYASPVRRLFSRCRDDNEERNVARIVSESGILHPEEKSRLAVDLSRKSERGREALGTFILMGDISPRDLSSKVDKDSALDLLIEASAKDPEGGVKILEFLRDNGSVESQFLPRVQRAIDGEVSPLRDTMDAVSDKIHRLLGGIQPHKETGGADVKSTGRSNLLLGRGFSSRSSSSAIDGKGRAQSV